MKNPNSLQNREVIGLIPSAGKGTRISPLPCSKELFPVGFYLTHSGSEFRTKVIGQHLLERLREANVTKSYFILRKGKWDIPAYFGDGGIVDMQLAYLVTDGTQGVPFTLLQAYPFVLDAVVALGFPDMIFEPQDAFVNLLNKQNESQADLVLGLFPALQPHKTDMVALDPKGRIKSIEIKPRQSHLRYSWEIAVWSPIFTRFMHDYVTAIGEGLTKDSLSMDYQRSGELHMAHVIHAAIIHGLKVEAVIFSQGRCIDIGTADDLNKVLQEPTGWNF